MSTPTPGNDPWALALDIGGTKIAAGVVDSHGHVSRRTHDPWASEDADDRFEQTVRIATDMIDAGDERVVGVGVGVPAVVNADGEIEWAPNLPSWNGLALRRLLSDRLTLPCRIGHDGQLAALGEYWYGAGNGAHSLIAVVIGTGVGGGFVVDGEIYGGASGWASAGLGWMIPDRAALDVANYTRDGSLEARAGGRALDVLAIDVAGIRPDNRTNALGDEAHKETSARALFTAAEQGNPDAMARLDDVADLVAILVANLVTVLSPEVVAMGGAIGLHEMMLKRAREVTSICSMPSCRSATTIVRAQLGGDAGLLGAAHQVFAGL